jgi:hypothetical protein
MLSRRAALLLSIELFLGCFQAQSQLPPADLVGARALRNQILDLSPIIQRDEAERVAQCAYATAKELRKNYGVIGPPLFHNFLVNTGIRKRGLCFQWAEDLLARLDALKLKTLELHWGEARAGTLREHNCVVVTAKDQPFSSGIILDCWRHSGHLYWSLLGRDHYPWVEDAKYAEVARAKAARSAAIPLASRHLSSTYLVLSRVPR